MISRNIRACRVFRISASAALVVGFEEQRVDLDHDDVDQIVAVIPRVRHDQIAGDAIDPPER